MNQPASPEAADIAAASAIANVLRAESAAQLAIEQAHRQAEHIADQARAHARAVAERTERRIRAVVTAFEHELAERLAEIEHEVERMAVPQSLSPAQIGELERAVTALAREISAGTA